MKTQIAKFKKNAKHYAPEILIGCTTLVGIAAIVYLYKEAVDEVNGHVVAIARDAETGTPRFLVTQEGNFTLTPYED